MNPRLLVVAATVIGLALPAAASTKKATAPKTPSADASKSAATPQTPSPDAASKSGAPKSASAAGDSGMTLRGGQEGTAFKSLTVEGEDRIHIQFERPKLKLDLDPEKAPGLDLGDTRDVLNRTTPDLSTPLVGLSAQQPEPYLGRPWLSGFASGSVARFQPEVENIERWRLVVANSRGQTVATYNGKGRPPRVIYWDGRSQSGAPVVPGLTYSYVFEAFDRAGNKRNFVGEGFTVTAYRLSSADGVMLTFSARELRASQTAGRSASATGGSQPTPPLLLEAASWLNQTPAAARQPIRVTAAARNAEQANALATEVTRALGGLVLGDPARIQATTQVEADAPEGGTVRISSGK